VINLNLYKTRRTSQIDFSHEFSIPKRSFQIGVWKQFSICHHNGRWVVSLTSGKRTRYFNHGETINRTQALKLISFLSDYVNMVKPTEETILNKSIRAKTNSTIRDAETLTGLAIKNKEAHQNGMRNCKKQRRKG
jgi:hypothetical protein